jgi:hypothetical protein
MTSWGKVSNKSNEVRTVLLLGCMAAWHAAMRLLSRLLIFIVRVMARLRGVGEAIG